MADFWKDALSTVGGGAGTILGNQSDDELSAIPIIGPYFAGKGEKRDLKALSDKQQAQSDAIKLNRPTLRRTQGSLEAEQTARINASTPNDALFGLGEQQIQQNQAANNRAITNTGTSGTDIIQGIIDNDRNTREQQMANQMAAYQRQYQNRGALYGALADKSQEELNMFDVNQFQPYNQDYLRKYNLLDASQRNALGANRAYREGALTAGKNVQDYSQKVLDTATSAAMMGA